MIQYVSNHHHQQHHHHHRCQYDRPPSVSLSSSSCCDETIEYTRWHNQTIYTNLQQVQWRDNPSWVDLASRPIVCLLIIYHLGSLWIWYPINIAALLLLQSAIYVVFALSASFVVLIVVLCMAIESAVANIIYLITGVCIRSKYPVLYRYVRTTISATARIVVPIATKGHLIILFLLLFMTKVEAPPVDSTSDSTMGFAKTRVTSPPADTNADDNGFMIDRLTILMYFVILPAMIIGMAQVGRTLVSSLDSPQADTILDSPDEELGLCKTVNAFTTDDSKEVQVQVQVVEEVGQENMERIDIAAKLLIHDEINNVSPDTRKALEKAGVSSELLDDPNKYQQVVELTSMSIHHFRFEEETSTAAYELYNNSIYEPSTVTKKAIAQVLATSGIPLSLTSSREEWDVYLMNALCKIVKGKMELKPGHKIDKKQLQQLMRREKHAQRSENQKAVDSNRRSADYQRKKHAEIGCALDKDINDVEAHHLGKMDIKCIYCGAHGYKAENQGTVSKPHLGDLCCKRGKIDIPVGKDFRLHPYIENLLTSNTAEAKYFRKHSRMFNTGMAMASVATDNKRGWGTGKNKHGYSAIRVSGQLVRRIGPLMPTPGVKVKFMQAYFYEPDEATAHRISNFEDLKPSEKKLAERIFKKLHNALKESCNSYINDCIGIKEYLEKHHPNGVEDLRISIHVSDKPDATQDSPSKIRRSSRLHPGRLNKPTVNEVSILFPNNEVGERCVVLNLKQPKDGSGVMRIPDFHRSYDPLSYPLFFNRGQDGWHPEHKKPLTLEAWVCYLLMSRCILNPIHRANRLGEQYIVDQWAKVESQRLRFFEFNQKKIRADLYSSVSEAVHASDNPEKFDLSKQGKPTILPSSFTGGDRFMKEKYHDAMALCRRFGRPHLFITMTCNGGWKEIQEQLQSGQDALNRPDICARVFKLKHQELMRDIMNRQVFGRVAAHVYSIEFQKRGYPHAHILIWFEDKHHLSVGNIDRIISAEIPPKDSPIYERVTKSMIHGPDCTKRRYACSAAGYCKDGFPKDYEPETIIEDDSYPRYRRRSPEDGGNTFTKYINDVKYEITNKDVVAYSPWLLKKYDCHINVEHCHSVKSIKYLFKYVLKGSDQANVTIEKETKSNEPRNEIKDYETKRYVGSSEACWRLFQFKIVGKSPSVEALPVHTPGGQLFYFNPNENDEDATEEKLETHKETKLTEYFRMCREKVDGAEELFYFQMPDYFTWNKTKRIWEKRKTADIAVGRMHQAHPSDVERFHLRLLLNNTKGATSFEHLRTLEDGTVCDTFLAACIAKHLTRDDQLWYDSMNEAVHNMTNMYQLRNYFAAIICLCYVGNPLKLYEQFREYMKDDFVRMYEDTFRGREVPQMTSDADSDNLHMLEPLAPTLMASEYWDINMIALNSSMVELEKQFHSSVGKSMKEFGLPLPDFDRDEYYRDFLSNKKDEKMVVENAKIFYQENARKLNQGQQVVFDTIKRRLNNKEGGLLFLDAPGGTGKTFTLNVIAAAIRSGGGKVASTAFSGIAATLLHEGRTTHNMFKIPINAEKGSSCNVNAQSKLAQQLRELDLVIIDEGPMMNKVSFECLDRTLRDLTGNHSQKFGGKVVLVSGDFRQILPVVKRGYRAKIVGECIKSSGTLWDDDVTVLQLTENMRVKKFINEYPDDSDFHLELREFEQWLLDLGDGKEYISQDHESIAKVPKHMARESPDEVMECIFGDIGNNFENKQYLQSRMILAADNAIVNQTNLHMVQQLPGDMHTFKSIDTVDDDDVKMQYPIEYLNSLNPSDIAEHELYLKVGAPVILLRNFNVKAGHCNGTRYIIKKIHKFSLELEKLGATGNDPDDILQLPRIPMCYNPDDQPLSMKRLQFPIKLAFAVTFHRSQGQSVEHCGILLPKDVWTHGQIYVAFSRCGNPRNIHVWAEQEQFEKFGFESDINCLKNVVYPEVLCNSYPMQ